MQDVVERCGRLRTRVAGCYGLDIFDVQYRREAVRDGSPRPDRPAVGRVAAVLELAEEGVSVEDCARVSRDLSAVLDVEDVVPTAYTLEVSSPGLDRPLRHAADYRRFAGRRAKMVMREAVDGQMFFKGGSAGRGRRDGRTGVVMIVGDDGRSHRVPLGVITRANLEVEF